MTETFVGANLKFLRTEAGLNQSEFCDLFSISRDSISNYENDKTQPPIHLIVAIARYFSIPIDDLVTTNLENIDKKLLQNNLSFKITDKNYVPKLVVLERENATLRSYLDDYKRMYQNIMEMYEHLKKRL